MTPADRLIAVVTALVNANEGRLAQDCGIREITITVKPRSPAWRASLQIETTEAEV